MTNRTRDLIPSLTALILFCFLCFVIPAIYPDMFAYSSKKIEVTITGGMSAGQAARALKESGVVRDANKLVKWMIKLEIDRTLRPGTYLIAPGDEISVANQLKAARPVSLNVMIIPGTRYSTINAALKLPKGDDGLLRALSDKENFPSELHDLLPDDPKDRIVFLLPETYSLAPGNSVGVQTVKRASRLWMERVGKFLPENADKKFTAQRGILASIVEGEAKIEEERPILAGIFLNRIDKWMPLQSCATVIYCWDELGIKKKNLTYKDLEIDSPYNTYRNSGLPPGPISVPSEDSWLSALQPAKTDYLFFFATPEGNHIFSGTYEEHLKKQKEMTE
ncbi:MAG: endolytic transglycosylase MltG [Synergistaceae bacterium]|nr:endolytic transglycosylase MltG [Synergistaceae bacterium]MBP9975331.1 endolytic transglycosylase MltG [Synergistaceae bacterium]MCE5183455.1 endolytic transglycosylase MltG [Synergistaceae bacterium]MDD4838692.1 endolytic transglycosylase MltG [Synergistaceae bacterium]